MIYVLFAASVTVLAGLPVWMLPAWPMTVAGGLVASFYVGGAITRSPALAGVAGGLSSISYALSLWWTSAPLLIEGAIGFGVALVIASDTFEFFRRASGAEVLEGAVAHRIRFYAYLAMASLIISTALLLLAGFVAPARSSAWRPILFDTGAVCGLLGMLRGYIIRRPPP